MANKFDDVQSEHVLDAIRDAIDELLANKSGEGGWENGVSEREVQPLVDLAHTLPDPFAGVTVNPIQEVRRCLSFRRTISIAEK